MNVQENVEKSKKTDGTCDTAASLKWSESSGCLYMQSTCPVEHERVDATSAGKGES